jgi:hypothetical protein
VDLGRRRCPLGSTRGIVGVTGGGRLRRAAACSATGPTGKRLDGAGGRVVAGGRAAPERRVWRRVAVVQFCFRDSSPEQREHVRVGGEKGARCEFFIVIRLPIPMNVLPLIFVLTDECTDPTFVAFKSDEYSSFIFLGIEKYKKTKKYIMFLCSDLYTVRDD